MRCPSCESALETGGACECGWSPGPQADAALGYVPPAANPELVLAEVLRQWLGQRNRWPAMMPQGAVDGARWWMGVQEPPHGDERPRVVRSRQSGEERVESPYVRRVRTTLVQFLRLPPAAQRLVAAAAEDGVWWRGEALWQFERFTLPAALEAQALREEHPASWRRLMGQRAREALGRVQGRLVRQAEGSSVGEGCEV